MNEIIFQANTNQNVSFQILNLPPIFISQDVSSDKCTCLGEDAQIFRKGKSCLFALPSKLLKPPLCSFPIVMSVYKKLPPSVLPDVMTIGTCQIESRDMVNSLLEDCSPNPCATLKNNFRIATATGQCCGEVTLFLRFSKLGKKVVTQFQNPSNNKPYLFKGVAQSPVFQCKQVPTICEDPFSNCVCKKPSNECQTEEKPKSCCQVEQPKSCCKESTPKPKKKGKRPCCSSSNNEKRGGILHIRLGFVIYFIILKNVYRLSDEESRSLVLRGQTWNVGGKTETMWLWC